MLSKVLILTLPKKCVWGGAGVKACHDGLEHFCPAFSQGCKGLFGAFFSMFACLGLNISGVFRVFKRCTWTEMVTMNNSIEFVLKESHLLCVEPNILKDSRRPLNGVILLYWHHLFTVSYGMGNAMIILYQGFGVSLRDVLLSKNCCSFGFCPNYLSPSFHPIWSTCTIFLNAKNVDLSDIQNVRWGEEDINIQTKKKFMFQ